MNKAKKLTVVYIITKLERGGAQKVCLSLLHGLPEHGIQTRLIAGSQGPLLDEVKNKSDLIVLDTLVRELSVTAIVKEVRCFFSLIKKLKTLKKENPDLIVHTHSTKAGILGRWAAACAGITTRIHTIHGYAFHDHQSWFSWLPTYAIELITSFITTHFVCVSSRDAQTGMRLFPYFAKKYSLIRAAIDWNQFYQPARISTRERTATQPCIFGTISCFKPQKNLFDLLNAFALVHRNNPNTRLEIIGDGALRTSIEHWIEKEQLGSVITLHGWQERVAPYMLSWNAMVMSSLWEGLPCAVVEARMLKIPVISYQTGGINEVIHHERNGLLYRQKDWRGLADGMSKLATNYALEKTLSDYPDTLADFQDASMIARHAKLYEQVRS